MAQNGTNRQNNDMEQDFAAYSRSWSDMMVRIWRDRIARLKAIDTGRLFSSVGSSQPMVQGFEATMAFKFVQYGIYVDRGVGNGFRHDNGGDLPFMSMAWRQEHGWKGKPRKPKPWFNHSLYISQRVLAEKAADIMGDKFVAIFDTLTDRERG